MYTKNYFVLSILLVLLSPFFPLGIVEGGEYTAVRDLLKSGNITTATSILEKTVREHPEEAEVYQLLGLAYLLGGDEVKASGEFDAASAIDKSYMEKVPSIYYEAGMILLENPKKSNIGLHYLNKYLLKNPDKGTEVADILYHKGLDTIMSNRFMAHLILERAMELNPSYEKDETFYFAYSVRSAPKSADMIEGGEDFIARFPESPHLPEVLYLIGEAYLDLRKPTEARNYFKRLVAEHPETEWGRKASGKLH